MPLPAWPRPHGRGLRAGHGVATCARCVRDRSQRDSEYGLPPASGSWPSERSWRSTRRCCSSHGRNESRPPTGTGPAELGSRCAWHLCGGVRRELPTDRWGKVPDAPGPAITCREHHRLRANARRAENGSSCRHPEDPRFPGTGRTPDSRSGERGGGEPFCPWPGGITRSLRYRAGKGPAACAGDVWSGGGDCPRAAAGLQRQQIDVEQNHEYSRKQTCERQETMRSGRGKHQGNRSGRTRCAVLLER